MDNEMTIFVLSHIWRNGGQVAIKNNVVEVSKTENIAHDIIKSAETIADSIRAYLKSVDEMDNASKLIYKMLLATNGWVKNQGATDFLNGDEEGLNLFMEYQVELTKCGWNNVYQDYRQFENEKAVKLKNDIYKRAVTFSQRSK